FAVQELDPALVKDETTRDMRRAVSWILGGPLSPDVLARARSNLALLGTLCGGMASRELLGGEPFWNEYRRRFVDGIGPPLDFWRGYFAHRRHQVELVFVPKK